MLRKNQTKTQRNCRKHAKPIRVNARGNAGAHSPQIKRQLAQDGISAQQRNAQHKRRHIAAHIPLQKQILKQKEIEDRVHRERLSHVQRNRPVDCPAEGDDGSPEDHKHNGRHPPGEKQLLFPDAVQRGYAKEQQHAELGKRAVFKEHLGDQIERKREICQKRQGFIDLRLFQDTASISRRPAIRPAVLESRLPFGRAHRPAPNRRPAS
ncbi:hypothetical protein SDC9_124153 [bioreactor metagenome]|uniref:Uncharacterized protein n=1 Tax=bioreactor metagenome TaxID=1076179 RepID=A0A645CJQ4_9ZZZZ